ncbi:N-acetylneuraminate synthase [Viridibacillus arvi]|uniref:N-acetylneuraminate synthase n=1 Tax=Viridibacillus arvi TaxID=263475 RepID=UPI003D03FFF5
MFNKSIKIANKVINESSPVFIIAEIGVNHNGDFELAKKMIDEAVEAKVDAVKFQSFYPDELLLEDAPKALYQLKTTNITESQYDMLMKLMISPTQMAQLKDYVEEKGLIFLSTPFDDKSIDDLEEMNVPAYKVSSTDTTNLLFLKKIARKKKPIILSTGMCTMEEIDQAINVISEEQNFDVVLLHCTSNYPTAFNEVNMRAISTLKAKFNTIVGYSDHTEGVGIAPYTLPLGVKVIEKHFTLDKQMEGPDHRASLNKEELITLVNDIRQVELSLGSSIKEPTDSEIYTKKHMQKRLVIQKEVLKDEVLTENHLTAKRSSDGIAANNVFLYLGKKVNKDLKVNHILSKEDIYAGK